MANPYDVTSASNASGGSATLTGTVGSGGLGSPRGTTAGDLVYVAVGYNGSGQTITSVTDSQSNTYTVQASATGQVNKGAIYASLTTHALVSGTDTITVNFGSTSGGKTMNARGCTGVTSATADKTNTGNAGTGTAASSGSSGTLSQASELVVGVISCASAGGPATGPSFGTIETVTNGNVLTEFDELVTATTAQTASATLAGSANWTAIVATFPYTPPAPPSSGATPYDVTSATNGNGASATLTGTAGSGSVGSPQGTTAGDLVYACIGYNGASQSITSVTDSKSNTYAMVAQATGSTNKCTLWASLTTTALVSGTDTVTVTFANTAGTKTVIVRGCSGVTSATADQTATASSTSANPSSGATGALAQASELVVGLISSASGGGAPTGVSFGTAETLANAQDTCVFDAIVTSAAAVTASGGLSSPVNWGCLAATFRYTAPAGLSPYLIGSNDVASAKTLTITPLRATGTGDAIIVAGSTSGQLVPQQITDTQSNAYQIVLNASATAPDAWTWACLDSKPVTTSDTITITFSATAAITAFAVGCSGLDDTASIDIAAGAQNTSAAPSVTSAALRQPNEAAFAVIASGNGGGSPTGFTSGWTQQGSTILNGTSQYTAMLTRALSSESPLTVGATITSANWSVILVTVTGPSVQAFATWNSAYCFSVGGTAGNSGELAFPETFAYTINAAATYDLVNTWTYSAQPTYGMAPVPIANTAGNGLVAFIAWNGTTLNPVSNVADDAHNFWTHAGTSSVTGDVRCGIWVCPNAQAARNLSVGLSWFAQALLVIVAEVSGFPPWADIDVSVSAASNSTGNLTVAGTAGVPDLCFTCGVGSPNSSALLFGSGWNIVSALAVQGPGGAGDPASTQMTAFWQVAQPGTVTQDYSPAVGTTAMAAVLVGLKQAPSVPVQKNANWPGVHVEMAFGYPPGNPEAVPVWTDVTPRLIGQSGDTEIDCTRGRQYESESPEAGDLTVTLNNEDGALTPGNALSPYGASAVQLGTPVRVWATWDGRAYAIAYGYTERIPQTWPDPQWGQVPWEAPDALDPLSNSQLPSALAGELLVDQPYLYVPCGETYLEHGASGLPLGNLSRINQRPMTAMDGVEINPNSATGAEFLYSRIETGQAWFTNIYGGIVTYTAAGAQGQGLNGDPGTAAIGADQIQKTGVAQTFTGGAFYTAPDLPQAGVTGISIEFWAIIPGVSSASFFQEILRVSGPANNYNVGVRSRGSRFIVRVNPGPAGTTGQDFIAINVCDFQGNTDEWDFTGTFTDNTPHHFAFVIQEVSGQYQTQVYVDGSLRSTRLSSGVNVENDWYYIGAGGLMHFDGGISYGYLYTMGHITVFSQALPASRILQHYQAGSTGAAGEDTVTRMAKLMTWGGFGLPRACAPASPSPLLGPADQIQGQSVADAASQVATTDGGMFFADAAGNVTWWPRSFLMDQPVKWILGDDAGETPYLPGEQYDYDNTFVDNLVTSQRVINSSGDGALATVASLPSQEQYFIRSSLQETVETTSDEDAYDQANWLSAKYSQPALRVQQVVLDPGSNPAAWPAALGIEQGDIVQLNRRPLGGAVISQTCIVQMVSHKIGPDSWQVTVNMIPYDIEAAVLQCDAPGYSTVSQNGVGWLYVALSIDYATFFFLARKASMLIFWQITHVRLRQPRLSMVTRPCLAYSWPRLQ